MSVVALVAITLGAVGANQLQARNLPPLRLVSSPTITEYPQANPPHSGAHRIVVGRDGALWYTLPTSNEIGRLSTSGSANFFSVHGTPEDITVGPDGNLWFTEYTGFAIGRLTPSGTLTEFALANHGYGDPDGIVAGPDGNLWFTYYQDPFNTTFFAIAYVGKVTPAGTVTNYPLTNHYAGAMGIAAGADGDIWVTENRQEAIDRITPATGADQVILLGSAITGEPAAIVQGPGSTMWFSETSTQQVGSISLDGLTVQAHALPPGETANGIAFDSSDDLWYADPATSSVGEMGPGGAVVETSTPTSGSSPYGIVADPSDDAIWFTENAIPAVATLTQPDFTLLGAPLTLSELNGLFNGCHSCLEQYLEKSGSKADPVNPVTGNFTESESDISIPGRGLPFGFTRTYNSANATINGPLGFGWSIGYGATLSPPSGGASVTVTLDNGSTVPFTQQGSVYAPAAPREIATLVHNTDGTWTLTLQAQEHIAFNTAGQETSESDLNGYTTTLTYTSGLLTKIKDAAARTLTLSYTSGLLTKVNDDQIGRFVTYAYNDGNGNLTDVTDVNGGNWHYGYDGNHLLTTFRDARANTTTNHYNVLSQVDWQEDALSRLTQFAYTGSSLTPAGGTTTVTDPSGNVEYDQYQSGVLVSQTKGYGTPQAATWTYQYDAATMAMTAETDPDGNVTRMQYDSNGNVIAKVDALGRWTTTTYNALNEPVAVIDPTGVTTTSTYDANGNLTSTARPLVGSIPLQIQTTTLYHADTSHPGDVTSMNDPDGQTWTYTYNSHGYRETVEDPLGNTSTTCYTAVGWITATYTPLAGSITCTNPPPTSPYRTRYTYVETGGATDEFGDVQKATDPLGQVTKYAYDADRNLVSEVDADSNTTTYVYDLDNEQTEIQRADSPQTTLITNYNADGTVNFQKDGKGNKTLRYGYDSLGRVTSEEDADSNTTTYTLDGDGNVLTTEIPGGGCAAGPPTGCITNTYDADNELKTVTYSDGTTPNVSNLTYDSDGRRLTMTDGTGTTTDVYDSLGRLTSDENGAGVTIGYGYDLKGQQTSIVYPGSHTVTYAYDNAGRLTTVEDWLSNTTTYTPNANSFCTGIAYQNGVNVTQTPNNADQNMGITDKLGATTLASMTYTRDDNNQVTGEADTGVTQVAQPFTYTPLNQVEDAGVPSYSYDAADNLTTLTSGTNQLFDAADELCWTSTSTGSSCGSPPSGATIYTSDTNGSRTTSTHGATVVTDGYDQANRLTAYSSATETASYTYDGDGLRMGKTVNGAPTPFTWDTALSTPLLLGDGTTDYIYGINATPIEQEAAQPAVSLIGEGSATGGTGAASVTVNFPAGYQVGDEIYVATTQSNTTTVSAPGTYTLVTSAASGGTSPKAGTSVYEHTIVASETSVTISYSGTSSVKAVVLADYRGVDTTLPVDVYNSATTAGGTSVLAPAVSPAYANDRLLVFQGARGTFSSQSWTAPSGMTQRVQINSMANVSAGLADLALTSAGATGTESSTFGGIANLATIILAIPPPPSVLFFQTDRLGSTRLLTDSAGVVRGTFSYDPYGNVSGSTGAYSTPLGWVGQYKDVESGLVYLRARYYDPTTAQFLTRDPELSLTRSPYGYVLGNPLNNRDPSGKDTERVTQCYDSAGRPDGSVVQTIGTDGSISGESCDSLNLAGGAIWGGSGEDTDSAIVPADVNSGHYNDGPVVNAALGQFITFTLCDIAFELTLSASGVPEVLEAIAAVGSILQTIRDADQLAHGR